VQRQTEMEAISNHKPETGRSACRTSTLAKTKDCRNGILTRLVGPRDCSEAAHRAFAPLTSIRPLEMEDYYCRDFGKTLRTGEPFPSARISPLQVRPTSTPWI